jgi:hypothetical protein
MATTISSGQAGKVAERARHPIEGTKLKKLGRELLDNWVVDRGRMLVHRFGLAVCTHGQNLLTTT